MGHILNSDREYRLLQQRLDRNLTGAPYSPTFTQILEILFTPEEAKFVRDLPSRPMALEDLSRKLNVPQNALADRLGGMAQRGLILDFEAKGKRFFALPPLVIGLFEYTFMRTGEDFPIAEAARLFDQYMTENDRFFRSVYQGKTQLGRALVREESLPEGDHVEVLDWERASYLVESAFVAAVSTCPCRHKASHLDKACDRPQRTCLTLNGGALPLIKNGLAEQITNAEAMQILQQCKEAGLAQTGDNVKKNVTYICNCCGCCCAVIEAVKLFDFKHAIVSSNWIMEVDLSKCKGCGKCAKACPLGAIEIREEGEGKAKRMWAVVNQELCIGCGV